MTNYVKRIQFLVYIILISTTTFSQGLFESAQATEENGIGLEINGYTRGLMYTGKALDDDLELKNGLGELSLKLKANKGSIGSMYSEIRLRSGFEYDAKLTEIDVRELYIDLYFNKLDFRIGKQIVAWGRADGINPTNNITPQNYFVRSPEMDDMRMGNFLLKGSYDLTKSLEFEAIWVPAYKESIYRYDLFEMPAYVSFAKGSFPDFQLHHSMVAFKLDLQLSSFDGSISYFNGYDPMMGIIMDDISIDLNGLGVSMKPIAYDQQTIGGDFSFPVGSFGLRGEVAYEWADLDYLDNYFVPRPEVNWVFGIDRMFGNFSLMAQYIGKYVMDYEDVQIPTDMDVDPALITDPAWLPLIETGMINQLAYFNALNFNQMEEWLHSISIRPSYQLFYETLELEVYAMYNLSTEEYMLQPMLTYDLADALALRFGGQYYYGDVHTQFDLVDHIFNSVFLELKYSF